MLLKSCQYEIKQRETTHDYTLQLVLNARCMMCRKAFKVLTDPQVFSPDMADVALQQRIAVSLKQAQGQHRCRVCGTRQALSSYEAVRFRQEIGFNLTADRLKAEFHKTTEPSVWAGLQDSE